MIDPSVLKRAENIARATYNDMHLTATSVLDDAKSRLYDGEGEDVALMIAQLAIWALPFFNDTGKTIIQDHPLLLGSLVELSNRKP